MGAIGGVVYSRQKKKAQEQKEEEEQKRKDKIDAAEAEFKKIDKDGVVSTDEYDKRSDVVKDIQKRKSAIDEAKKRAQGILAYYQQFVAEKVVPPPRPSARHRFGAGGWTGGSEGLCSRFVHVCGR